MRRSLLLVVAFCGLGAAIGQAQPPPTNTVKFDASSPAVTVSMTGNSISASGTYTLAPGNVATGKSVLYVVPTAGGAFLSGAGPISINPQTLGQAKVSGLLSGQYTVYAVVNFQDGAGVITTVSSPTAIVNVP